VFGKFKQKNKIKESGNTNVSKGKVGKMLILGLNNF